MPDVELAMKWCQLDAETLRLAGVETERQQALTKIAELLSHEMMADALAQIEKLPKRPDRFLQYREQYRMVRWLEEEPVKLDKTWARCAVVDLETVAALGYLRVNVLYGFSRKIRPIPSQPEIDDLADKFLVSIALRPPNGTFC